MIFLLEAKHKHKNREKIGYHYPLITLLIVIGLSSIFSGFNFIIPLACFLISTCFYIQKNSIKIFGKTSFVFRGTMETSLYFLSLAMITNNYFHPIQILLGIAILLP